MTKVKKCLDTFSVYIGTYSKYCSGSIYGAWLQLSDYSNYDELLQAMRELHQDEDDLEFMFQDYECSEFFIKQKLISECHLSSDIYEIAEQIDNSDFDFEVIEAYADCMSYYHKDIEQLLESLSDSYYGEFDSDEDFAQTTLEQDGSIPENLPSYIYIDWQTTARNLMYDYMSSNGYYFRN
ncbi:MAG: antirestriction protein [Chryseobacterium sp.]|jgi:antirestriction protein|uniref:antirestriction protein ArdA n=1 Tax=Chryseobacterium sp. TaxID=1871047 RepID=UPI002607FF40|nr:antirestriction protein ArdA [Chryseobacterium sp.]MDF2552863.1 antirestriction protein [Chryseobacterium sp.]